LSSLRQPYTPIPPEITTLTGTTDEMVAGKTISLDAVEAFIRPADLVIAHNQLAMMRSWIGYTSAA
jgi:DNA polymerase III subunit epsilon